MHSRIITIRKRTIRNEKSQEMEGVTHVVKGLPSKLEAHSSNPIHTQNLAQWLEFSSIL
jgi:hypothetical protein